MTREKDLFLCFLTEFVTLKPILKHRRYLKIFPTIISKVTSHLYFIMCYSFVILIVVYPMKLINNFHVSYKNN